MTTSLRFQAFGPAAGGPAAEIIIRLAATRGNCRTRGTCGTPRHLFLRLYVSDNQEDFVGLDETELSPCELFDGRGVFSQPPCLLAGLHVLAAGPLERLLDTGEVAAGLQERDEALVADDRVHDQDDSDKA